MVTSLSAQLPVTSSFSELAQIENNRCEEKRVKNLFSFENLSKSISLGTIDDNRALFIRGSKEFAKQVQTLIGNYSNLKRQNDLYSVDSNNHYIAMRNRRVGDLINAFSTHFYTSDWNEKAKREEVMGIIDDEEVLVDISVSNEDDMVKEAQEKAKQLTDIWTQNGAKEIDPQNV